MLTLLPPAHEIPLTRNARVIGEGSQAVVYAGANPHGDACNVAFKVPRIGSEKALKRELDAFKKLGGGHESVLRLLGTFKVGGGIGMILDLYETDLLNEIDAYGPFSSQRTASVTWHISSALKFIHEKNLVICDLKLENVLLRRSVEGDRIALADLGLVHKVATDALAFTGTAAYMAPEALILGRAETSRDMWALGVTVFGLLTGLAPFGKGRLHETIASIKSDDVPMSSLPAGVSLDAKNLISRLLAKDPADRPTATELLQNDPFVATSN